MADKKTYYATGRRKDAVARVYVTEGNGSLTVNKREIDGYLKRPVLKMVVMQPLKLCELDGKFDIRVVAAGGGLSGQAGAIRHGISRALLVFNPELRGKLKEAGFLTRDSRTVERKKYGLAGARRRYQFSKR